MNISFLTQKLPYSQICGTKVGTSYKKRRLSEEDLLEKSEKKSQKPAPVEHPADSMNLFTSVVFWSWLVGTTFWSLDFVIPLDFTMNFMTDNGIERNLASSVMSALGISEIIARALCAITGEQKVVCTTVWHKISVNALLEPDVFCYLRVASNQ